MTSITPDLHTRIAELEAQGLSSSALEAIVLAFEGRDPHTLTRDEHITLLAVIRLHRRTTSGPSRPKGTAKQVPVADFSIL